MPEKKLAIKQVSAKVLSFTNKELETWIYNRLHGTDPYFSTLTGHDLNLAGFLSDTFHFIKDESFRDRFLEILGDLVMELKGRSPREIEKQKEYIYELLTLCASIPSFEDKTDMTDLAGAGKFKGFKVHDTDLHVVLLTTLASYKIGGNAGFWIEQMRDDFSTQCANAAFYAFLNNRFSLDILFRHIHIFIDRAKDHPQFDAAIESLFDDSDPKEIRRRFLSIETNLSREHKDALDRVFRNAGYEPVFNGEFQVAERSHYVPHRAPTLNVSMPKIPYGEEDSLETKTARIFKTMGYAFREPKRTKKGHSDFFIKKKLNFRNGYDMWLCRCSGTQIEVGLDDITDLWNSWETLIGKIYKSNPSSYFGAIFISDKGYSREAGELAETRDIILMSFQQLLDEFKRQKPE